MGDTYDSWKVTTLEKKGYRYPFIFPQEIYALKHLKILNFHLGGGFTYVTLSEQIGELRKLKALSMDGRTDNVVVPVSLLKNEGPSRSQELMSDASALIAVTRGPRRLPPR